MSLSDWLANRWLNEHQPGRGEIDDLLAAVEHDLANARIAGLTSDWRLNIAFTAAIKAATAALAAAGYQATREQHHYRVIHSLAFTIGADDEFLVQFDMMRKKRNVSSYERMGTITEREADLMVEPAEELRERVKEWLESEHPGLVL